jgi:hypothetical protein
LADEIHFDPLSGEPASRRDNYQTYYPPALRELGAAPELATLVGAAFGRAQDHIIPTLGTAGYFGFGFFNSGTH